MMEYLFGASVFVHLALLFYCLGFLARDELWLRGYLLTGTVFYLIYYFTVADRPLWDAIFASATMGIINFTVILIVVRERSTFGMTTIEKESYRFFSTLTPGQFRKILRYSETFENTKPIELVTEGEWFEHLYFLFKGEATLTKAGQSYAFKEGSFIGEIGFLMNQPATASVTVEPNSIFLKIPTKDLRYLMERSQPLENALIALFSEDMAIKVAGSRPIAV